MPVLLQHPAAQALLDQTDVSPASLRPTLERLDAFLDRYRPRFLRAEQGLNAAHVLRGKLSALDRKTSEPIAREAGVPRRTLQQFVGEGCWDDHAFRAGLRVAPDGVVSLFTSGFRRVQGLAFDAAGNLYLSEFDTGSVKRVTPDGVVASGFPNPVGLAFDPAGSLYVSDLQGKVNRTTLGTITLLPSLPSLPINVGASTTVAGLNLSDAELARLHADRLVLGSAFQTGDVTLTTTDLTAVGDSVNVLQDQAGPGRVLLNDESAGPALKSNVEVQITAGTGGISAGAVNGVADVAAPVVAFDTAGSVGSVANRLQLATGTSVRVGAAAAPRDVFLDGLGDLILSAAHAFGTLDVTARGSLTTGPVAAVRVALAADTRPDGAGDDGAGTLKIGADVAGATVTLSGADVRLDGSVNGGPRITTLRRTFLGPQSLAADAAGNLFVADIKSGAVIKVPPVGTTAGSFEAGRSPQAVAVDGAGNLYVAEGSGIIQLTPSNFRSIFATGFVTPKLLAVDAAGSLYVLEGADGAIRKVTPAGVRTLFASGFAGATGLAFDAAGDLFVSVADGTVRRVRPSGADSLFATGFGFATGLAFDTAGNLYVAEGGGTIFRLAKDGRRSAFASGLGPLQAITFDPTGNLFVATTFGNVIRVAPARQVTVRPSLASRPVSLGGADSAVAGVNLTDAELSRLAADDLHLGGPTQAGDIVFASATFNTQLLLVEQGATSSGTILLDSTGGSALEAGAAFVSLQPGAGGFRVAGSAGAVDIGAGELALNTAGDFGSAVRPVRVRGDLGTLRVGGNLFVSAVGDVATVGAISVGGQLSLGLPGNLTVRPGDIRAAAVNLAFAGSAIQQFDSGGLKIRTLSHTGTGTLRLLNSPLVVTGNFVNTAGSFDANSQAVNVAGAASILGGAYLAGAGAQAFTGGLVVEGAFVGGSGVVVAGSVAVGLDASLIAPSSTFTVTGDWSNLGGVFNANGGAVVFASAGAQRLSGANQSFRNLTHSGRGVLTIANDLTLTGSFANLSGAGNVAATGRTLRVAGNWSWGATGTFLSAGSSVILTGAGQRIDGSTTFNNLTKTVTAADMLTFQSGSTQTFTRTLTLNGAFGAPLSLRSSRPGQQWRINPTGARSLAFLDVQDSRNLATGALAPRNSRNAGRNIGWSFPATGETWTGAASSDWNNPRNWSGGWLPDVRCTVTLRAGAAPVLTGSVAIAALNLDAHASLALAGHALNVAGALHNRGTLVLRGDEPVRLAHGNDTTGGTWRFVGAGHATLTLKDFGAIDYFNVVIGSAAGFRLGNPLVVKGTLVVRAGDFDTGRFGVAVSGPTEVAGGHFLANAGVQTLGGGLIVSAGEFRGGTGAVRPASVRLTGGLLAAPATLFVSGDWANLGGAFDARGGRVVLNGRDQRLYGSTTFFDLSKTASAPQTLTFQAGSKQTVAGALTLRGDRGNLLSLRSSQPGDAWSLAALDAALIRFADLQDGANDRVAPLTAEHSTDSGGNDGWIFR